MEMLIFSLRVGVIEAGIIDHFITYCTWKMNYEAINKHNTVMCRSMKNYGREIFTNKLKELDWELEKYIFMFKCQ